MKHHPDRNQGEDKGAEAKFKEAKEAYEMLSNAEKRAAYDQYGHAGVDPNMRAAGGGPGRLRRLSRRPSATSSATSSAAARGAPGAGAAARSTRQRPLVRDGNHAGGSRRGKEAQIRIPPGKLRHLPRLGAKPGTQAKTVQHLPRPGRGADAPGFFSVQQTCPHCRGTGKIIPEPCTTCHGQGRVKKQKTLEVKIPAGIDDGMRIRSAGNGEPGTNGGPPGDLYIEIRLKKHDIFERDGDDLHCVVPISFTRAALGGEIEVPTLQGKAAIDIPKAPRPASSSACAARASRACAPAIPATCIATSRWKRR
jgi:molecular chaperone DnaJ